MLEEAYEIQLSCSAQKLGPVWPSNSGGKGSAGPVTLFLLQIMASAPHRAGLDHQVFQGFSTLNFPGLLT